MPSFRHVVLALLWHGLLLVLSINSIYLLSRGEPLSVRTVLRLEDIRPRAEAIVQRVVGRLRAEGLPAREGPPAQEGPPARPPSPDSAAAGTASTKPSPEEKAFENGRTKGQTKEDIRPDEDIRRALPSPGEEPREYQRLFNWAARRYGVEKRLLKAVVRAESAGNPRAQSHKGAIGLMQIMPRTAMRYLDAESIRSVEELYLPITNISVGASHLAWLQGRVQALFPGARQDLKRQVQLIAAAYNAGLGDVQRYRGVPPYRETRIYVRRVWHWHQRLPPASSTEGE